MIFKQVDELLSGQKTQTRRIKHDDEIGNRWYLGGEDDTAICEVLKRRKKPTPYGNMYLTKWGVGKTYPVTPKMYQSALPGVRIRITAIREEHLQDITEADAIAEGVESVEAYRALWNSINGPRSWDRNPPIWVIGFEVLRP